ncbi:Replication protein O [Bacillus velezensis]|uniref:Replication protein O n=1 Tax=Bacillus velezensis TaxID=492670 RepID=UPI0009F2C5B1|nr:Replication protein O [Bacillus velezensis]OQV47758.1 Replication protein O [Bacillus velezensis]OQV51895.1 Replication protein O [Bacillus velezensis]OQV58532.1 Replication protein O [Bacillus velezensis]OQV59410.1 Replication protein O [Bacillus velezensis]
MIGWIKLHRSVQDHWIYQEKRKFSKYEAWLDLLMMASHKDNKFVLGNELYDLKRGEFISSIRKLGERWSWSNTKVTQFLDLLKKDEMIDFKKDTKKTLITIVNYGVYHDSDEEKKTVIEHKNDTKATQKHTIKNEKNVKNEKNIKPSRLKYEICDMENAEYLFKEIQNNNPDAKKPNLEKWANEFRLIRERDKRTDQQIKYLINWSQQDSFWKTNILSPASLRKQFDRLVTKIKSDKEQKKANKAPQLNVEEFDLDD